MARKKRKGPREPNGRLSRAKKPTGDKPVQEAADKSPLELRAKVFGLSQAEAKDQKAGSFIGRLRLARQRNERSPEGISEDQYEAGLRYLELRNLFHKQIGAEQAIYERGTFSGVMATEEDRAARWATIRMKWLQATDAIQQSQNATRGNLFAALDYCVIRDESHTHMIGDLRQALNALHGYFAKGKARRAA